MQLSLFDCMQNDNIFNNNYVFNIIQTIGSIRMVPLVKKRKQKVNDDLTVKLEPVTYDDVITKYGLEFALDSVSEHFI